MRIAVLWGLMVLLYQHTLVRSHILGRPPSATDLIQLKALLGHFEEILSEAGQEKESEADYEATDQQSRHSQTSRAQILEQERDLEPLITESQLPVESLRKTVNQRSRLQDLLMTNRKWASSCFGARMDRIGNASGLGCNNGRG